MTKAAEQGFLMLASLSPAWRLDAGASFLDPIVALAPHLPEFRRNASETGGF